MATGGGDPLTQLAEDLLSCEVCTEEFHPYSRPPRILPCYHTFCGVCVEQLTQNGRLKCPKCRQETAADKGFPKDTTRVALMEWKRSMQNQEGITCEGCQEGGKATSKCQDCSEYLCSDCTSAHRKMKIFKSHCLVSLSEAAKSPEKLAQKTQKCDRHVDEKLKLFCLSCSEGVCGICALTQHEGHKFVELETALDDMRKKVLSVCEELEEAQKEFQKKAEESESRLRALDTNHRDAASRVKDVFSEVVSTALEREKEELGRLDEQVREERLLLEEQLDNFRSLQVHTQSAADYGRRLVSMSISAQLLNETQDLERTAAELKMKVTTPVAAALTYTVGTQKLEELKAMLRSLGKVGRLPLFPDIRLDHTPCHRDCKVAADGCSLIYPSQSFAPQSGERFQFLGTCATAPLPAKACYWEVRCRADPNPVRDDQMSFCEVGMACMETLQDEDEYITGSSSRALTAELHPVREELIALAYHEREMLIYSSLVTINPSSTVERTLGFLVQPLKSLVTVFDVDGRKVLCAREIDMSQPLWPAVSALHEIKARVRVSILSGQQVALTPDMKALLQDLVQ